MPDVGFFSELLRQSTASKAVGFAVCLTSAFLIFAPVFTNMHPLPSPWNYVADGFFIFSGALLVLWICQWALVSAVVVAYFTVQFIRWALFFVYSRFLSSEEAAFLRALGDHHFKWVGLDNLGYAPYQVPRLQANMFVDGLVGKGVIERHESYEHIVGLTKLGKRRAIQLMRESQRG